MRRQSKRVFAAVLLLALTVAALYGCGKTDPDLPSTQPPMVPPPTTTEGYSLPQSPYLPQDFEMNGDYLSCTAGNYIVGLDVSHHQGKIDWQKVAAAGIEFVFVRLGYRGYETGDLVTDSNALENLQGAREAGLLVGAYMFSQAISVAEAQEEAHYALDILGDFKLDLPLVYDWEYVSETARTANVSGRSLTEFTIAFCETVKNAGIEPMLYFSVNVAKYWLNMEKLERYGWWLAMYNPENPLLCQVDAWQYTNEGRVDGISTVVDINLLFTDYGVGSVFGKTE